MSAEVTEPKSWPFSPDLRVKLRTRGSSFATSSCACTFLSGGAARGSFFHLFNDGLVGQCCLQGQLAGEQEIAAVAVRHLHDIAAVAEVGYVFFQNDFHLKLSRFYGRPDIVPSVRCVRHRRLTFSCAAPDSIATLARTSPAKLFSRYN